MSSMASNMRSRCPSERAPKATYSYSLKAEPRPMPIVSRPSSRLSSRLVCIRSRVGWWIAICTTAKPTRMRLVRCESAAPKTIGSAYPLSPVKLCSVSHA